MQRLSRIKGTALLVVLGLAASGSASAGAAQSVVDARTAASVLRIDRTHVSVQWATSSPVDILMSDRPDADIDSARLVTKDVQGPIRREKASDMPRPYFLLRSSGDGATVKVAERVLPLEHGSNFRDIGGYPAAGGKHVRWGSIYRSGATPLLSERDIRYLRTLHLTAMIDLRSLEERELAPTRLSAASIHYVAIDYHFDTLIPQAQAQALTSDSADVGLIYRHWLISLAPQFQAVFRALLAHTGPVVYHCTAGQDRTGVATALVLLALGAPREVILQDFLISTQYRRPQYEIAALDLSRYPDNPAAALLSEVRTEKPAPLLGASGRPFLADVFDEIDQRWGNIDNYLREVLGVDAAQVARLRADYLE